MSDFRDVAAVLQEKGWQKGALKNNATGERCLIGACIAAGLRVEFDQEVNPYNLLEEVVAEQYPDRTVPMPYYGLGSWRTVAFNDAPETCLEEVLAVLEKAQVRLEEVRG